jgi:hypothetical protein
MKMEFVWAEGDLDSGRGETASHVASIICQNLSQKMETVMLNWMIVKSQILNTGV